MMEQMSKLNEIQDRIEDYSVIPHGPTMCESNIKYFRAPATLNSIRKQKGISQDFPVSGNPHRFIYIKTATVLILIA